MSRDKALKVQFSNSIKSKNKILFGSNFALYLSWEEVYRKIALIWSWPYLMNINEVMNFSDRYIQLSIFSQRSEILFIFSLISIGNIV